MKKSIIFAVLIIALIITSFYCIKFYVPGEDNTASFISVIPSIETTPVESFGDAADDPAIWYNEQNPSDSRIIGTNKQLGLAVYKLDGKLESFVEVGRPNNCDVFQGFLTGSDTIDLIGASNRKENTISIYEFCGDSMKIAPESLLEIKVQSIEVYGFCFYHPVNENNCYAISVGKDGLLEKYRIDSDSTGLVSKLVRKHKLETQCEGLAADAENGYLYVGEENRGVWKFDLKDNQFNGKVIASLSTNKNLAADIEGITIYYGENGNGYLLVSSQGNNSYAVFNRKDDTYIGSFRIEGDQTIDGTAETDGIDVISLNLGEKFPHGLFIAQDGINTDNGREKLQNFKLVPWERIAKAFDL